jgi:hypothetical protein
MEALRFPYRGVNGISGENHWWWEATARGASWNRSLGSQQLQSVGINGADFGVVQTGGPYVDLNGTTEYLYYTNLGWQHFGANSAIVWGWVNPTAWTTDRTIFSKWHTNQYSWDLLWYNVPANYSFIVSPVAGGAGTASVDSTQTTAGLGDWTFVMGFFDPSTLMKIYVAKATDDELVTDRNVVAIPAAGANTTADFMIGATGQTGVAVGSYWSGKIGIGNYWLIVPGTEALIDAWAAYLFHLTKPHYRG